MQLRFDRLDDRICPTTLPAGFSETPITIGLNRPTAMALAPDGRVFIAEQAGTLRVVESGTLLATPFVTLTVDNAGERGLLGIAFDPAFASNSFVYVYYTVPGGTGIAPHNRVSRFIANGNVAGAEQVLVDLDPLAATNHNGGAIHFGPDGKLYVGVGDNADSDNPQSLATRLGKMLRYDPDGSIPADNPTAFAGIPGTPTGANRAIWAVGLRNPYTFAFQPGTGRLIINDVGQNAFEEIDDGFAGANYGWPQTEGDFTQSAFPEFTRPLHAYPHGTGNFAGRAVIGGAFYNPAVPTFPLDFAGDYFFGDLVNRWINRYDATTKTVENFASDIDTSNLVGMEVTPAGDLLYLTWGGLFRISADSAPPPFTPGLPPVLVGPGPGGPPVVTVFDRLTGGKTGSLVVFDASVTGGVRVAAADITGDGIPDVLVAAGPGGLSRVRVFDGATFQIVRDFTAFEPSFTGGVFVAAGDIDGDGRADLVVTPDESGGPRVRIVSGKDGTTLSDFFGIEDPNFRGGARAAAGDFDNDGRDDVAVAAGFGGGPRVAVFDGPSLLTFDTPLKLRGDFFAFEPALRDGVFLAAGDLDGDGFAELVTAAGPGGAPRVQTLAGATVLQAGLPPVFSNFFAGDTTLRGGARVTVNDLDGDGDLDLVAGSGAESPSRVAGYSPAGTFIREWSPFDSSFTAGVYVG